MRSLFCSVRLAQKYQNTSQYTASYISVYLTSVGDPSSVHQPLSACLVTPPQVPARSLRFPRPHFFAAYHFRSSAELSSQSNPLLPSWLFTPPQSPSLASQPAPVRIPLLCLLFSSVPLQHNAQLICPLTQSANLTCVYHNPSILLQPL